jgi:NAD-dependent deacetylase
MIVKNGIVFILGSGASVDSGLRTYRGKNGLYKSMSDEEVYSNLSIDMFKKDPMRVWNFLSPLIKNIKENKPGKTYDLISSIVKEYPESIVLTQNVDGYCKVGCMVVELHGNYSKMKCCGREYDVNEDNPLCFCGGVCKPGIVLYGEDVVVNGEIIKMLKNRYKAIIVIGTTLLFPYLRKLINKCKQRGTPLIHINPDEEYDENIKGNEVWLQMSSSEGLEKLIKDYF